MDLSGMLDLFGYSVYDPKIEQFAKLCNAPYDPEREFERYDSLESNSYGISLWFWWKKYYIESIGEPLGIVKPEEFRELVFFEARLMPNGLENAKLPYGLSFPATPDSVLNAIGRKPNSKLKNVSGEPVWIYYQDALELKVIFEKSGEYVRCFKIIALRKVERQKIDFLESLKTQKQYLLPERIPEIKSLLAESPPRAWQRRMKSGDNNFTLAAIEAAEEVFKGFIDAVCTATQKKNPKSITTAVTKATKALNKVARQHPRFIETMEREEIVAFFNRAMQLTGMQFDSNFDLTAEHRSW